MKSRFLLAFLLTQFMPFASFSQTVITLPTSRPIPPEETRPEGRVIDVVGIQIGDTFEEARQKLATRVGEENVELPSSISILGDTTGNQISFAFNNQLLGQTISADGERDSIEVYFTPAVSEERVVSVHRTLYSGANDIDIRKVVSGLEEKYGPASWKDMEQGGMAVWLWHSGQHTVLSGRPRIIADGQNSHVEDCGLVHQGGYSFGMPPLPKDCDMAIKIEFVPGRLDGLASSFGFDVVDYKRLGIAAAEADAVLKKAFEDYLATIGGKSPDL